MSIAPVLSIKNISKSYANGVRALDGVTLKLSTGVFGLLGPNGAGKSTLMRTLATLQEPDAGEVELGDIDLLRNKHSARKVLGFLPQDFDVYPRTTAEELLIYFMRLKGYDGRKVLSTMAEELLHRTNLWNVRKHKLGEFSGGMRQRFGVAQALIGNPQLVMVDEPTAGLDPEERLRILDLLSEVGDRAVVLLSTHIVDDVADVCSQMAIIDKGRLLMQGSPNVAIDSLKGHVWRATISRDEAASLDKNITVLCKRLTGGRHTISTFSDGPPDQRFKGIEPSLEHVYFHHLYQGVYRPSSPSH